MCDMMVYTESFDNKNIIKYLKGLQRPRLISEIAMQMLFGIQLVKNISCQ